MTGQHIDVTLVDLGHPDAVDLRLVAAIEETARRLRDTNILLCVIAAELVILFVILLLLLH